MPCPGRHFDDDASIHPIPLNDLLELHPFKAKYYSPHCKPALVAFVIDAAQEQRSLRALGSMYSLSQAHVAEGVITTSFLHRHLSQPFPPARGTLPESRLARQSDGLVLPGSVRLVPISYAVGTSSSSNQVYRSANSLLT